MPLGLLTGLGAALAWGTLDIFSALASRRVAAGAREVSTATRSTAPAAKSSIVRAAPLSEAIRAKTVIASMSSRTPP